MLTHYLMQSKPNFTLSFCSPLSLSVFANIFLSSLSLFPTIFTYSLWLIVIQAASQLILIHLQIDTEQCSCRIRRKTSFQPFPTILEGRVHMKVDTLSPSPSCVCICLSIWFVSCTNTTTLFAIDAVVVVVRGRESRESAWTRGRDRKKRNGIEIEHTMRERGTRREEKEFVCVLQSIMWLKLCLWGRPGNEKYSIREPGWTEMHRTKNMCVCTYGCGKCVSHATVLSFFPSLPFNHIHFFFFLPHAMIQIQSFFFFSSLKSNCIALHSSITSHQQPKQNKEREEKREGKDRTVSRLEWEENVRRSNCNQDCEPRWERERVERE